MKVWSPLDTPCLGEAPASERFVEKLDLHLHILNQIVIVNPITRNPRSETVRFLSSLVFSLVTRLQGQNPLTRIQADTSHLTSMSPITTARLCCNSGENRIAADVRRKFPSRRALLNLAVTIHTHSREGESYERPNSGLLSPN